MGRFAMMVELANYEDVLLANRGDIDPGDVRRVEIDAVVDTGAARLVIPQSVADRLGVPRSGKSKVRYADQRTAKRDVVRNVWLKLLGRDGVFSAVIEPKRDTALLGAIVLEELDLVADCVANTCHPRDPDFIISEIE